MPRVSYILQTIVGLGLFKRNKLQNTNYLLKAITARGAKCLKKSKFPSHFHLSIKIKACPPTINYGDIWLSLSQMGYIYFLSLSGMK
jgi:hypothetical protein